MKQAVAVAAALVLAGPAFAVDPGPASVRGIQPIVIPDNPTCSDIIDHPDIIEYKLDSPYTGVFGDGNLTVEFETYQSGKGPVFNWKTKGGVIQGIVSKGGPNGNFYKYAGTGFTWDKVLHSPVNPQNGNFYGLSHISVCYLPGEPSIRVEKSCEQQTADLEKSTTISSIIIENDGDFDLTAIRGRETSVNSSCEIISVNGADVAIPAPGGQDVDPGVGGLSVGEAATLQIACDYPLQFNVPNEVLVKGEFEGTVVTDVDSSNPKAECPLTPDPMVRIDKECERTRLQQEIVGSGEPALIVEACPSIIVENTGYGAFFNTLETVIVKDPLIPELAAGVDVGPLAPGEWVDVRAFLGLPNLCYQPKVPQQAQNNDPDGIKFDTLNASFENTAYVKAFGKYGTAKSNDTAVCPLCDCPEGDCPDEPQ